MSDTLIADVLDDPLSAKLVLPRTSADMPAVGREPVLAPHATGVQLADQAPIISVAAHSTAAAVFYGEDPVIASFTIKQNDTAPSMRATLLDANSKPIPLAGASVVFNLRPKVPGDIVVDEGAVNILDAVKADVEYLWQPGDTEVPGLYNGEFRITFGDGSVESVPNDGHIDVEILAAVGGATSPLSGPVVAWSYNGLTTVTLRYANLDPAAKQMSDTYGEFFDLDPDATGLETFHVSTGAEGDPFTVYLSYGTPRVNTASQDFVVGTPLEVPFYTVVSGS